MIFIRVLNGLALPIAAVPDLRVEFFIDSNQLGKVCRAVELGELVAGDVLKDLGEPALLILDPGRWRHACVDRIPAERDGSSEPMRASHKRIAFAVLVNDRDRLEKALCLHQRGKRLDPGRIGLPQPLSDVDRCDGDRLVGDAHPAHWAATSITAWIAGATVQAIASRRQAPTMSVASGSLARRDVNLSALFPNPDSFVFMRHASCLWPWRLSDSRSGPWWG
ncbi:hypothetical protein ACSSVZ_004541 [Amorphus sp. MBR-141]